MASESDRPKPKAARSQSSIADGQRTSARERGRSASGCFIRLNGVFVIIGSLGVGILGWLVLTLMADTVQRNPDQFQDLPGWVSSLLNDRGIFPLLAGPPLIAGIVLLANARKRAISWGLFILAMVWLFALFAAILISFIMMLAPLYQIREL
jgi:hypothetical protein